VFDGVRDSAGGCQLSWRQFSRQPGQEFRHSAGLHWLLHSAGTERSSQASQWWWWWCWWWWILRICRHRCYHRCQTESEPLGWQIGDVAFCQITLHCFLRCFKLFSCCTHFVLIYLMFLIHRRRRCIAAGVGRALSVCLSVCPLSKRKTAWAINKKVCRHTIHGRTSACTDLKVKRLKVKF